MIHVRWKKIFLELFVFVEWMKINDHSVRVNLFLGLRNCWEQFIANVEDVTMKKSVHWNNSSAFHLRWSSQIELDSRFKREAMVSPSICFAFSLSVHAYFSTDQWPNESFFSLRQSSHSMSDREEMRLSRAVLSQWKQFIWRISFGAHGIIANDAIDLLHSLSVFQFQWREWTQVSIDVRSINSCIEIHKLVSINKTLFTLIDTRTLSSFVRLFGTLSLFSLMVFIRDDNKSTDPCQIKDQRSTRDASFNKIWRFTWNSRK